MNDDRTARVRVGEGVRRMLAIVAGVSAVTLVVSLLGALALGSDLARAVATGFYLAGAFFIVVGVFSGVRGPVRPGKTDEEAPAAVGLFGIGLSYRGVRTATATERQDALVTAVLFLGLGVTLIVFGVLADSQVELL